MQERSKHLGLTLVSHNQPTEVLEPGDRAFDFPAPSVTSEISTVLSFDLLVPAIRADQLDSSPGKSSPERVTVSSPIINQPFGILARSPSTGSRDGHLLQCRLDQR